MVTDTSRSMRSRACRSSCCVCNSVGLGRFQRSINSIRWATVKPLRGSRSRIRLLLWSAKATWKLTQHGEYTAASPYKAQFVGSASEPELAAIWKSRAPPKCKFFAWLFFQNRAWTLDRLAQRNWDHSPSCPLCRTTMETALHLLSECRYSRRVWSLITNWVRQPSLRPGEWRQGASQLEWWTNITTRLEVPRDASRSLALLVTPSVP
jgi:hypothetical protein